MRALEKVVHKPWDTPLLYDGTQLRPLWIYETYDVSGDAIAVFQGPADVQTSELVDMEDQQAETTIQARLMIHCIAEHFGNVTLREAVLRQHLFMQTIGSSLQRMTDDSWVINCIGDDLWVSVVAGHQAMFQPRKLSVSIATVTPVSTLLHVGINLDATGAPSDVSAIGLDEYEGVSQQTGLNLNPERLAGGFAETYKQQFEATEYALTKVRPR
jgi:hypothetical protein